MKIQYTSVDLSQSDMRLTSNEKNTEVEEKPLFRSSRSSSVRYSIIIYLSLLKETIVSLCHGIS